MYTPFHPDPDWPCLVKLNNMDSIKDPLFINTMISNISLQDQQEIGVLDKHMFDAKMNWTILLSA